MPNTGAKITVTEDGQDIETRVLGFTISPHEECVVEEAVQLVEKHGGSSTVLTLGPEAAIEQLRGALAMGIDHALLLETDGEEWGAVATAQAIVEAIQTQEMSFDMILFGNEAADTGSYQVGIRVAHALDLPCVAGIKSLSVEGETAVAQRESSGGWENYEVTLPAIFTIKEGINLPRYPSFPGKLRAKKKPINRSKPQKRGDDMEKLQLKTPKEQDSHVTILGKGADAAPKVAALLQELGVI
ncbi:electron transfer flavoprotein subunit beta/FixA family protein [Candidatus Leptofilum sp.]|uniref:electron transfer flavoprotein subunit beta/FixA family protein n=1 Tax=Candidatus Leptofilum sp. TaxID=3241576 RepID=UPI003B5B683B